MAVSKISAAKEAHEEVGIIVDIEKLNYECTDVLGTTCTWDLIYWSCDEFMFDEKGAHFHDSEANEIEGFVWLSMGDACKLALDSTEFSESRSACTSAKLRPSRASPASCPVKACHRWTATSTST